MNLKKLFVVGSMLVVAWTTANAELVNGVRQRPNVAKAEKFQVDAVYYLFNTKARLFFAGANDWNTRASVADHGYKVKFVTDPMETFPGALEFTDSVETQKAWKATFSTADGLAIWVDNATETYRFWEVVEQPNGVYRISNNYLASISDDTKAAVDSKFLGWRGSDADTRLYFVDPAAEGAGVDWAFVTEETYKAWVEAWTPMKDQFNAAAELLTWIKTAEEKSIDVSDEKAIYANEDATVEALNAAVEAIQVKIKNQLANGATVDNPADMTASVNNPGFADGKKTGWSGDDPAFGEGAAEYYQKNFDLYQTLKGMPNGVYGVGVQGFYRTSFSNTSYGEWQNKIEVAAKVYAKSGADSLNTAMCYAWDFAQTGDLDELKADGKNWKNANGEVAVDDRGYIPDNMKAASYLFAASPDNYKKMAYVAVDNGELTIGLKKKDDVPGGSWTMFDNFTLSYFGTAPEAYQMALEKGVPAKTEYSTAKVSEQYIGAYNEAYTKTASDKATFSAAVKAVADANDSIAKNMKLWADVQAKRDEAYGMSVNADYSMYNNAFNIGDYLESGMDENGEQLIPMGVNKYLDAEAKTGDYDLSNKQLEDIIATLNSLIEALNNEVKEGLKPGTDVTRFLTNPGFEDGKNGWTIVSKGGGNVQLGGNDANHCYEAWHSTNFDVYQEVNNLPVGLYKLEVNGYVRYLDGQDAIDHANEAPAEVPIYVYMNDSKTNLVSWLSYPKPESFYKYDAAAGTGVNGATYLMQNEENCFPDNMTAASAAFADGGYLQATVCLVAEPNTVTRIGVKGTPEAKFWPIFDNFKLTYLGNGAEIVKPQLEEKIAEAQKYDSEVTTKTAKANLTNEVAAAQALLTGEDGDAMLAALDKLQKAIDDVKEGKAVCQKFTEFIDDYMQFANTIDNQEALQLGATILENLNACAYDAEDIDAKKLELREMRLKVQLPADYAQGSAEGVDLTPFIQTPGFSMLKDGVETNSNEGWQGTAGSFGPSDQMSNLCLEFYNKEFDMYQDLAGVGSVVLPHGYYALRVSAFNRPTESNPAYLYAVAGKDTLDVTTIMLQADGINTEEGESAPNNVSSAKAYFDEGRYLNTLKFKFEGDTLRIGVKHPVNAGTDWVIMDDFKLFFYGNDNTGVETVMNIGKPAKVQYFTLDGRQVSVARKGLFIRKTTMDNGAVVVRKIQK